MRRALLAAVLVTLEREGNDNSDPVAIGLVKVMKYYRFVACFHLMCEVLPHLSLLSRLFQATYTDWYHQVIPKHVYERP